MMPSSFLDTRRDLLVADIGGTHLRVGRLSTEGRCEVLATVPTPARDWEAFCAAIGAVVSAHAAPTSALSISFAGVVDPDSGAVIAANLPSLNGRALGPDLQTLLGMPVVVHNDAACAALAEAHVGAGVGHRVMFCAVLGTGVGGGLVIDGRLVIGAGGLTGEWGHGPIVNETTVRTGDGRSVRLPRVACGCGQVGCVNTFGGARGLERLHAFLNQAQERSSRDILDAWIAGDPAATATLDAYVELVSDPLALVANVIGPSVVPVFGGLGRCAPLVSALDVAVRRKILRRIEHPLLVPSTLTDLAGLIGAAYAFTGADR